MSSVGDEITSVDQIGTMRDGMVWVKATNPLWAGMEEANPYKPGIVKSKTANKLVVITDAGKITVTLPTPTDEGDFQWKAYKKTSGAAAPAPVPRTTPGGNRKSRSRKTRGNKRRKSQTRRT